MDLEAFDGSKASVRYNDFSITGADYDLTVNGFYETGPAGIGTLRTPSYNWLDVVLGETMVLVFWKSR